MADVTLPPNVRQVLEFVVDDCRRAIAWEDPSPYAVIGYRTGSLETVLDLVGSVLADPAQSRDECVSAHWDAAEKRRAERRPAPSAPAADPEVAR